MHPICVSIPDAARAIGIGRTTIYQLIAAGRLHPIKIGRRTLIPVSSIQRYIEGAARATDYSA
jgi:excisionase family DNA binding protein